MRNEPSVAPSPIEERKKKIRRNAIDERLAVYSAGPDRRPPSLGIRRRDS